MSDARVATSRNLSGRLHVPIVGPTSRSDWSVRLVGPTIVSCKRFVRPVGQTFGRIKHVWFRPTADPTVEACGHYVRLVGPTGQSDDQSRCSVGGIITSSQATLIWLTSCGRFGYSLSNRSVRLVWQTVGRSLGRSDPGYVRRSERVNASSDWSDRPVGPTGRSDDRTV